MAMVVKNNMSAVKTLNTLNKNSSALQKSLAKVSSGMKINSAQDDASGYAISERMRVQIRSLDQANQNTQNASSLMKTAEGAVSSTVEILKSLKEKAINAATDTNTDADRATIQKELDQFIDQIDDNALTTFNGKYLVDGSKGQSGMAVATAMTNQSLGLYEVDGTTELTGQTELTNLTNRNGDSLEISSADYVTASFVKGGKTYTTKFRVGDESTGDITTLEGIFQKLNAIEDEDGNAVTAFGKGTAGGSSTKTLDALAGASATSTSSMTIANLKALVTAINGLTNKDYDDVAALTSDQKNYIKGLQSASVNFKGKEDALSDALSSSMDSTFTGAGYKRYSLDGSSTANATSASDVASAAKTAAASATSDDLTIGLGASGTEATAIQRAKDGYNGSNLITSWTMQVSVAGYNKEYWLDQAKTAVGGLTTTKTDSSGSSSSSSDPVTLVTRSNQVGISTAGDAVYTADNDTGLTVTAATAGIEKQISGLTISITDSEGNVKKSANAALDAFNTTIYAKNKSESNELTFQVGAKANQSITVGLDDMRSEALGLKGSDGSKVSVATQDKANAAVSVFDNAIQKALDQQATIGAIEARLEYTSQNLTTSSENVQAAESTIRDADMAKEMTNYTKNNVLLQAAQSMLAQANQNSSAVLSLLQ